MFKILRLRRQCCQIKEDNRFAKTWGQERERERERKTEKKSEKEREKERERAENKNLGVARGAERTLAMHG